MTPNAGFDEANGLAGGTSLDFSGSDEVEVEYSVQIRSADVSDSDTIQLRVKSLDSYTNTPYDHRNVFNAAGLRSRCFSRPQRQRQRDRRHLEGRRRHQLDPEGRRKFQGALCGPGNQRRQCVADKTLQLEYNRNGGGWNDVTGASSVVRAWLSPNVADGADTTQQVGSGTFVTPNAGFDEVNGLAGGTALDFSGSDEVEVEYSVQIRSADVANDDTIQLRVKGLTTYTNTPSVTVTGILEFFQDSFRGRNNDGSETTATWIAAANTNWTQAVETEYEGDHFQGAVLWCAKTAASVLPTRPFSWSTTLTAAAGMMSPGHPSVIRAMASDNLTEAEDTTQQLGSGTFISNNDGVDETNGQAGGTVLDFAGRRRGGAGVQPANGGRGSGTQRQHPTARQGAGYLQQHTHDYGGGLHLPPLPQDHHSIFTGPEPI